MDEKGIWRFSPVYDVTFSYGPGGEHSTMYLGEGKNPTTEHLSALAKKHGIKKGSGIITEVREATKKWKTFAKEAGTNPKSIERIGTILKTL